MRALILAFALALPGLAFAQAAEVAKPDAAVEERLKRLAEELRCLVCQNQTIADSNAPLALDLRNQIRQQIAAGRDDDQIRTYMVERYGDFVLYRPPFKGTTAILWLGPLLLIVIGAAVFVLVIRKRRGVGESAPPLDPTQRAQLEALLEDAPVPPPSSKPQGSKRPKR
jgi:cytochrome c-type biogenesis protein CcmH